MLIYVGEATVTLQDVQVVWGLPIEGEVVSGIWYETNDTNWIPLVVTYLGIAPQDIAALAQNVGDTIESHQQRARVYILALMGGVLFSDSNAYDVPLSFLHTIIDLSPDRRISWGSAVLAHLYRNLCKAATNDQAKAINENLALHEIPPIRAPYGSRWHGKRTNKSTPAHVLPAYRSVLAALTPRQFIWQPYDAVLLSRLPRQCTADRALWSYRGAIIFWATIETHLPDRVCRAIAPHITYIGQWNDRANRVFVGRDGGSVSRDYFDWYKARTVFHITDLGIDEGTNTYPNWAGTTNVYEEGLWRMQDMAFAQMQPNSQPNPQPFFDMPH
ncbi:serine/threonine-protein phosphatase 7 long form homolog [Rutidosis leptorrhynchoides]|uniref:serine/threonine-protein phosphatase 7 long form homolog n=1 Tax=Rutidosis leptorrhynchoides TaxID=125765 RepID=UPI003A98EFD8